VALGRRRKAVRMSEARREVRIRLVRTVIAGKEGYGEGGAG